VDAELGFLAFEPDAAALPAGSLGARAALRPEPSPTVAARSSIEGKVATAAVAALPALLLPRACPKCGSGRLSIKHSRYGPFVGCSTHPACTYAPPLPSVSLGAASELANGKLDPSLFPRVLGTDPEGREVSVRVGPFGLYVQASAAESACAGDGPEGERMAQLLLESAQLEKKPVAELKQWLKEKGHAGKGLLKAGLIARVRELAELPPPPEPERRDIRRLPQTLSPLNVTLESATHLFDLPRALGEHPELGGEMVANQGIKAGYVQYDEKYYWLEEPALAFIITPEEAAMIITEKQAVREAAASKKSERASLIAAAKGDGVNAAAKRKSSTLLAGKAGKASEKVGAGAASAKGKASATSTTRRARSEAPAA